MARASAFSGGTNPITKAVETIIGDPFIPVTGFGLLLMVLFLFMPLIDQASVDKQLAKYNSAARKIGAQEQEESRKHHEMAQE